jgi:pilus assembly protein CpaF
MLLITIDVPGQAPRTVRTEQSPCRIGRSRDCEVPLSGWRIGRVHADLHHDGRSARIVDRGTIAGTSVNGERIAEFGPLTSADLVEIGGHRLRIEFERSVPAGSPVARMTRGAVSALVSGPAIPLSAAIGSAAVRTASASPGAPSVAPGAAAAAASVTSATASESDSAGETLGWRRLVHRSLLQTIDLRRRDLRNVDAEALRAEIRAIVEQLLNESIALPSEIDRAQLVCDVLDEALGLGPLERLLEDPAISEIMVNAADEIWVERDGRLQRHPGAFSDDDAIRNVIDRIVAPIGRRIDEGSPMVDARLADGSRVNAVIPPLAVRGPALTIRRFNRQLLAPDDLHRFGSASAGMLAFLRICVQHRRNIVISGGTGSGKTTLLNLLSNLIPRGERIITIEDSAELTLRHEHLVQLEARPPNLEGRGEVAIRDLVRNALRMRPDRIVVGECRGGETLDMLQAMNTGHDGSLTTIHANSPRDVVSRLEVMTLMAGIELPVQAIREQIASAVDVIVHQARYADGVRRIASITEVTGIDAGRVQMLELFRYEPGHGPRAAGEPGAAPSPGVGPQRDEVPKEASSSATGDAPLPAARHAAGRRGRFSACDAVPTFYESLREMGVDVDLSIFERRRG